MIGAADLFGQDDPVTIHPLATTVRDSRLAWWRDAVIYQIYPRSWADGNGDGIGDLPGITSRLPYLRDLGVDAIWISPFYLSPMADAGYDVADYKRIDPLFGDLDDADALIAEAKRLGLRILVDLVPNHTSDEHEWFQAALAAGPGSRERDRYLFRDGLGIEGNEPPNNWDSVFGGGAWERTTEADGAPGQWYLHIFDTKQPDLNWENPEVQEMFRSVLRFWLDRGVDGFRVDVAHGMVKASGLPDVAESTTFNFEGRPVPTNSHPMWDQDGVHEIYRDWRRMLDEYNPEGDPAMDRILCAEAWVEPMDRLGRYVRSDEMHQSFNFPFLDSPWRAADLQGVITESLGVFGEVGAPASWVLSNHDVIRHASRLGYPAGAERPIGIGAEDVQPNAVIGLRRARAATALMLALPGSAYIYQGEELGLPEHTAVPNHVRQDPMWERTGHKSPGRDGCRIPMPWVAGEPAYGFGTEAGTDTWLPMPEIYGALAVDRQEGVAGSTLEMYRTFLALRRDFQLGSAELTWVEGYPDQVLALRLQHADQQGSVLVLTNFGDSVLELSAGARVLASSQTLVNSSVPTDTTVWIAE